MGDGRSGRIRPAVLGAAALLGIAFVAGTFALMAIDDAAPARGVALAARRPPFANPIQIASQNGLLETTFTVQMADVTVRGKPFSARTYNGLYVPPTLRVRRGDTIRLHLTNLIDQPTNLHTHGLNVSPLAPGDNVFTHVATGETYDYEITIPADHPVGMFYYHPHQPGLTEPQIMGGMSGLLVVEGLEDVVALLRGLPEQQMVLKDTQIRRGQLPDEIDPSARTNRTLNGLANPTIEMRPGETQLWRIANIGADLYYPLRLQGHDFFEIARDGNLHNQVVRQREILLPPSARVDVLVQARRKGRFRFRARQYSTGPVGDSYPGVTLATVVVKGPKVPPITIPTVLPPVQDLRGVPNPPPRTIVFSETADGNTFFVNGKTFDENRIDTTVQLGTVEAWTIKNCTREQHVFHIHQLDFQVTEVDGEVQPFVGHQDTVNVPIAKSRGGPDPDCEAANDMIRQQQCPGDGGQMVPCVPMTRKVGTPGSVRALIPFTNPVIVGKFVYHCHIGEHEDNGMMNTIEVVE